MNKKILLLIGLLPSCAQSMDHGRVLGTGSLFKMHAMPGTLDVSKLIHFVGQRPPVQLVTVFNVQQPQESHGLGATLAHTANAAIALAQAHPYVAGAAGLASLGVLAWRFKTYLYTLYNIKRGFSAARQDAERAMNDLGTTFEGKLADLSTTFGNSAAALGRGVEALAAQASANRVAMADFRNELAQKKDALKDAVSLAIAQINEISGINEQAERAEAAIFKRAALVALQTALNKCKSLQELESLEKKFLDLVGE